MSDTTVTKLLDGRSEILIGQGVPGAVIEESLLFNFTSILLTHWGQKTSFTSLITGIDCPKQTIKHFNINFIS